ncbi:MAG: excinuclease ABC subunit UvrC [Gammaproteobacteria bacterium]|nr:excinuclease ABC subunit UvrC [Thiopseudomonas sp.]NLD14326.1 excinuclease ABC subunit UvrC [Gammaproteobacteria bacterium]
MISFNADDFLQHCTRHPGVYRMFDAESRLLYVGKAKNLKNRLTSYFKSKQLAPKTAALVAKIAHVETTITPSETEALLLEQTLIKEWRPPYNILLRDDKSYPYVLLSNDEFPTLSIERGQKKGKGRYFGPYPSAGAIRESLALLQKAFQVRQCSNSFYNNRSRPCLQYQIKRCKAPCVGLVSAAEYAEDVRLSSLFLEGRSDHLTRELSQRMEQAAEQLEFEQAAQYRDQISLVRRVQDQQSMEGGHGNLDVIAAISQLGGACVHIMTIRDGRVLGGNNHFPKSAIEQDVGDILAAFLGQYYLSGRTRDLPDALIVNQNHAELSLLAEAFSQLHGKQLTISHQVRGTRARWQRLAVTNAEQALQSRLSSQSQIDQRFIALAQALDLDTSARFERIECFDISHTQGEATVASCVVFGREGARKNDYRRFNISGITPGDDYAAMHQALTRRFAKHDKEEGQLPDVLLIDGGKGQLQMAREVLDELAIVGIILIGVAKGVTRKAGMETLFLNDSDTILELDEHAPALHLIQQVRDEAHRFAITGHRARRGKTRRTSTLEGIAGVGPKRRRELLNYFGGLQELSRASIDEIAKTPGISTTLAETIYQALHPD